MTRRDFIHRQLASAAALTLPGLAPQSLAASASRPRLFFPPARVSHFRARLEHDSALQARWASFRRRADELLTAPLMTQAEADAGPGSNAFFPEASRQMVECGFTLGLAWQVTREERYAAKLREALLHAVAFDRWQGASFFKREPSWRSSLWTAAYTVGCAAGCDALDDSLAAPDRARIVAGILRLGVEPLLFDWVLPGKRMHALDSMGHNWWAVCVAGAGVGALALLQDDPRAAGWVQEVDAALAGFFDYPGDVLFNKPPNFDPAGGFYEGVAYASYSLVDYLTFRLARTNALPGNPPARIPVLERAAEFFTHTTYPSTAGDLSVNFGDSPLRRRWTQVMRLLAMQGFAPALSQWYLQRPVSSANPPEREDPLGLLYLEPDIPRNGLPRSILYPGIGWAILRSTWDNDATMLAVKCGHTWNHAHADAGSFILFHAGRPLLIDSGACSYGRREYTSYYTQSRAHNVVLFNGQGQPREDFDRGARFPGRLHGLLDALGVRYLYADATGPMARYFTRHFRHWLWIDDVILVFDDLRSHEAGRFDWLLHYEGDITREERAIDIANGPARARVTMLFPESVVRREEEGLVEQQPDRKRAFFAFSNAEPAREQKFIAAIVPQPANTDAAAPLCELLREPLASGVRIRNAGKITDVYLNLEADGRRMHFNSANAIAGWETDAYLFAVTYHEGGAMNERQTVSRYFVSAASYLRRNGRVVLESLAKINAVVVFGPQIDIHLAGPATTGLALGAADRPARVAVNDRAVSFGYSASAGLVRVPANELR